MIELLLASVDDHQDQEIRVASTGATKGADAVRACVGHTV